MSRAPIPLSDVADAVLRFSGRPDVKGVLAGFLEQLRAWAAPSAVIAAVEDGSAEAGWRLVPGLCLGTAPVGAERAVAQLVEEVPEGRVRPLRVATETTPDPRSRETWLLPFAHDGASGVLVLKGVPADAAPNLGEALLLASLPVWPRLLGSPAERVEAIVREVQRAADRLKGEAARHAERLETVRQQPPEDVLQPGRLAEAEAALAAAEARLAEVLAEKARSDEARGGLESELAALRQSAEAGRVAAAEELALVRQQVEAAAAGAGAAEAAARERDEARAEVARLTARVSALEAEARGESENLAARVAEAEERATRAAEAEAAARAEVERLTSAVATAEGQARADVERLRAELAELQARARADAERQAAERTEAESRRASEAEAQAARIAELEAKVADLAELEARAARVAELEAAAGRDAERLKEAEATIARLQSSAAEASALAAAEDAAREAREAREERDQARAAVDRLSAEIEGLGARVASLQQELEARAREVQTRTEELRARADEVEELRRAATAAAAATPVPQASRQAEEERDQARAEVERLTARVAALEAEKTAVAVDGDALRDAIARAERAESEMKDAEDERDRAREETRLAAQRIGSLLAEAATAADTLARLQKHAEATNRMAEEALVAAHRELEEKKTEVAALAAELDNAKAALAAARHLTVIDATVARPAAAASDGPSDWDKAVESFRGALLALRRAPYVSSPLRSAIEAAGAAVDAQLGTQQPWLRVALLERDLAEPQSILSELEAAGVHVRLATHPEELALLAKSPEGRDLDAAICDVMAFRPDQNVAGLFRAWEKDKPGLLFYLSFAAQQAAELERAKRVPLSLLAGHVQRPLKSAALVETLQILARKMGRMA